MKLRHRLALVFALSTSAMLIVARTGVSVSFIHVQSREFDELLEDRARLGATEVARLGRKALERSAGVKPHDTVEHTVTLGALYRADGTVLWAAPLFAEAPELRALPVWNGGKPSGAAFDLDYRAAPLRGVVVEIDTPTEPDARYLLIAASRHELDADARQLRAIGIVIVLASSALSLVLGWWIGRRMTRGLEAIASAAYRVTEGDLDVRVDGEVIRDAEVAALAVALHRMLERLKALIDHERRFASNAAHELRSPLTALRGELELALRRPRTNAEYERALRDALDDANRLIGLSEDLLVFARATMRRSDGKHAPVSVRELVEAAIAASVGRGGGEGGTPIDVDLGGAADVSVQGEPNELVRVVRNLVDNAVAHARDGGRVRVRAVRDETDAGAPRVRIEVEDDGAGVPSEVRDRIFEPFVRGDEERGRSGAGLGLAIARELANRFGGDLLLESPKGPTRFVLRLSAA